jgi:hypothetical protein
MRRLTVSSHLNSSSQLKMFAVLATAALGASAAYSQALSPESIATSGLLQ